MNYYEEKRARRVESLRRRAEKKREFANENDLSLASEEKSGIPLGQPILIGHHSEGRHRRHLERIEKRIRRGFEAAKEADELDAMADAAAKRTAIDSDNPDAARLLAEKLDRLVAKRDALKRSGNYESYQLTNMGAEIRRLKKRIEMQRVIDGGFEAFEVNGTTVCLDEGQVQITFKEMPSKEVRDALKRSPLCMKWSRQKMKWVRKHTAATAGRYFRTKLKGVLS